jgi:hypothetical protein
MAYREPIRDFKTERIRGVHREILESSLVFVILLREIVDCSCSWISVLRSFDKSSSSSAETDEKLRLGSRVRVSLLSNEQEEDDE